MRVRWRRDGWRRRLHRPMGMGVRIGPRLRPTRPATSHRHWHGTVLRMPAFAVLATVTNQPGLLFGLTKVLADRAANITYVDIIHPRDREAEIYLEFSVDGAIEPIARDLGAVPGVSRID